MKRTSKAKNIVIIILSIAVIATSIVAFQSVKANTMAIVTDYDIAYDAFVQAAEGTGQVNGMKDEEILLELGNRAYKSIRQTRELSEPLFVNDKWYSKNLEYYLDECHHAQILSQEQRKDLIDEIDDIAGHLGLTVWRKLYVHDYLWSKGDILETIENVDNICGDFLEEYHKKYN